MFNDQSTWSDMNDQIFIDSFKENQRKNEVHVSQTGAYGTLSLQNCGSAGYNSIGSLSLGRIQGTHHIPLLPVDTKG